ncbi:MAG: hypothetical protein ACREGR_05225 [Minisyncoccia bacterium]
MSDLQEFKIETDNLEVIEDTLHAILPHCMNIGKPSDNLGYYVRNKDVPSGFHDGSEYVRQDKSVIEVSGKIHVIEPCATYHGATFQTSKGTYPDKDAAAEAAGMLNKKTLPTRLWVCTAGVWRPDAGKEFRKPRGIKDLINMVLSLLDEARKYRKEQIKELHEDDIDGSVGSGLSLYTSTYAFTTLHCALTKIYYPK